MKTTNAFKETIEAEMQRIASIDNQFAIKYNSEGKNIDDCITYILNQVQKSGCNGFSDAEIFGMATHYYDEESIEIGKQISARVVVNHTVELSEEEKQAARKEAKERFINDEMQRLKKRHEPIKQEAKHEKIQVQQGSLF